MTNDASVKLKWWQYPVAAVSLLLFAALILYSLFLFGVFLYGLWCLAGYGLPGVIMAGLAILVMIGIWHDR
jgi:hypothetical protein